MLMVCLEQRQCYYGICVYWFVFYVGDSQTLNFKNTEGQNTIISSALVNEKSAALFHSVPMLGRKSLFNITLQDNEVEPSSSHIIDIERQIKKSNYPLINNAYGSFVELNDTIDAKLAKADPVNVLNVFPDAIIYSVDFTIAILSAELYLRDGYIDSHTENTGDSFPEKIEARKSKYSNWKICKIIKADGGEATTKPIIGHQKYNILITGSLVLSPLFESPVSFGPKCPNVVKASKRMDCNFFFAIKKSKIWNIQIIYFVSTRHKTVQSVPYNGKYGLGARLLLSRNKKTIFIRFIYLLKNTIMIFRSMLNKFKEFLIVITGITVFVGEYLIFFVSRIHVWPFHLVLSCQRDIVNVATRVL
jgi:hypothetical protein